MLIDAAAYVGGRRVTDRLPLEDLAGWLARDDAFVWLGLRMPNRDEMTAAARSCGLEDLDVDQAVAPHDRPVVATGEGFTWLVLRTSRYNDALEQVDLGELSVLFHSRLVITVRYGQASPLGEVRRELEVDPDRMAQGPGAVVAAIIGRVVEDYRPTLNGFEKDVLEVEKDVFGESRRRPLSRLYRLKRQVMELFLVIDALHHPLARLARTNALMRVPEVTAELQMAMDELNDVVARVRTLSDLITTAVEANLTQVSLQQNEDMRKISAWVAIAAVPTMIAGIYGMNFTHMPELDWSFSYPLVLLGMGLVCGLLHRYFRRNDWL